jgi:hypothetical protein
MNEKNLAIGKNSKALKKIRKHTEQFVSTTISPNHQAFWMFHNVNSGSIELFNTRKIGGVHEI